MSEPHSLQNTATELAGKPCDAAYWNEQENIHEPEGYSGYLNCHSCNLELPPVIKHMCLIINDSSKIPQTKTYLSNDLLKLKGFFHTTHQLSL